MDLTTTYLGLKLENPIVVASSGLTKNVEQLEKCQEAGAGAAVMKSIFEEQIQVENNAIETSAGMHGEAYDYIRSEVEMQYGIRDYLESIETAKKKLSMPVIASINCHTDKWWMTYASQIAAAGADALEINMYVLPFNNYKSSAEIEEMYVSVVKNVKEKIDIPVALKLSPYFTGFDSFVSKLVNAQVDGLVLFNRFTQPDIDLDTMQAVVRPSFDDPSSFYHTLRWVAVLSAKCKVDIAASGNIVDHDGLIKQLLAGATVGQMATILYQGGYKKISEIKEGLANWMQENSFNSISNFRGKLNQHNADQAGLFERSQYIKYLSGLE